jgi:hypothetical protein
MMKVKRDYSPSKINEISNRPDIYPWVHGNLEGPLDFTGFVEEKSPHVNLMGEHGGCIFSKCPVGYGLYEGHVHIAPKGRGRWALTAVKECIYYMFTSTDAVEIWCRCPAGNIAVHALVRALKRDIGGSKEFRAVNGWIQDRKHIPADIYSIQIQDWMRSAKGLVEWGRWFQGQINEEFRRLGKQELQHEEDETHNRYVGAAVEMIRNGQAVKGVVFYNRWAAMAAYQPIHLVSNDPITLNVGEATLELHGKNFFVSALKEYAN